MKVKLSKFVPRVITGKTGVCYFAITHNCNAKCVTCSIHKIKNKPFLELSDIKKAIDKLDQIGITYLQLTGGEPLLHPKIVDIVKYGNSKGIIVQVVSNGSLLNRTIIERLAKANLSGIAISIDHFDQELFNKMRGIPNLFSRIEQGIKILKEYNIDHQASVTITRKNFQHLDKLCEMLTKLDFEAISFCYPITSTESSFQIGSDSNTIRFSREEKLFIFNKIIELKKKFKIFNSIYSLKNIIKFLNNERVDYNCVSGYKIFYLDWNLTLFRCHTRDENFGNILELEDFKFKRRECNKCMIECCRDPSIYFHGFRSIMPITELLLFNVKKSI
ncbi:radical SAM protein [Nanoarchaeota archaeon]